MAAFMSSIPGGNSAISDALARRGLKMPASIGGQISGGSPFSMNLPGAMPGGQPPQGGTPPPDGTTPQGSQGSMGGQSGMPMPQSPESQIIVGALAERLKFNSSIGR